MTLEKTMTNELDCIGIHQQKEALWPTTSTYRVSVSPDTTKTAVTKLPITKKFGYVNVTAIKKARTK